MLGRVRPASATAALLFHSFLSVASVASLWAGPASAEPRSPTSAAPAGPSAPPPDASGSGEDDVLVRGSRAGGFVSQAKVGDGPREVTDAASLVEPLPGVHVRRLGADDAFATMSIRGTSSSQVAVFLAGVPLTGGADPTLDLATLPLWPGARAKVYRSFAPAALGRGSLGGTLVLSPPSPRDTPKTDLWAAGGSFGSLRLRVGDVHDLGGARIATGVSASRSDDDFRYLDPFATASANADVYTVRQNAGHAAASGLVSLALPLRIGRTTDGALTVTALAQARRQELPGTIRAPTPMQSLASSRTLSAIELTVPVAAGTLGVRGWGRRETLAIRDSIENARLTFGPIATDDVILAAGGSLGYIARPTTSTRVELRVDGSAERFAPGTWVLGSPPPGARRTNGGLALDIEAGSVATLLASASARGDAWADSSAIGTDEAFARPTGHVGLSRALGPVIVASHAGYLARPPSFVERYGNRGGFLGDPELRPESALTVDAGGSLERRFGVGSSAVGLHAEVAGFGTWAEDLITYVYRGAYRAAQATNIGEARLFGLEAELRLAAYGLEARASHTALATRNASECRSEASGCVRPPLPGRPAHDFVFDLTYVRGPLRLRYGIDVVTGIHTDTDGTIAVPDRVLHGFGARLAVPHVPGLTVAIDIRNLFDLRVAEYEGIAIGGVSRTVRTPIGDAFDYPIPGRRFLLSARFAWP